MIVTRCMKERIEQQMGRRVCGRSAISYGRSALFEYPLIEPYQIEITNADDDDDDDEVHYCGHGRIFDVATCQSFFSQNAAPHREGKIPGAWTIMTAMLQ